MILSYKI